MNSWKGILFGVIGFCLMCSRLTACGVSWRLPVTHFEGVDEKGHVCYSYQLAELDLGNDLRFPLIINFRSDREAFSPYCGKGWALALLESGFVQTGENAFLMTQPDGWVRPFYRQKQSDLILNGGAGWKAEIKNDSIVAWADCGWRLTFNRGRLAAIGTPKNRQIDFIYSGGKVVELREGGSTKLNVEFDQSTGLARALAFNGRRLEIAHGGRPRVQVIAGQSVVDGFDQSLRHISAGPGDETPEFEFAVNDKLQPTLTIPGKVPRKIAWDPASRQIIKDGDWVYEITAAKLAWENAAIGRKNGNGQSEFWYADGGKGQETVRTLDGRETTITSFTSGVLAGKLRSVRSVFNSKEVSTGYSYDEKGRLLRETDNDGAATGFKYDTKGRLVEVVQDGKLFARRVYDEKGRLSGEETVGVEATSYQYQGDGGPQKVTRDENGLTSNYQYDKTNRLVSATFSDGSGLASLEESAGLVLPKSNEKREAVVRLLTEEMSKLSDPQLRTPLVLKIGTRYTDEALGPVDVDGAIKIYETLFRNPDVDASSRALGHCWAANAYLYLGRTAWPLARDHLDQVLRVDGSALAPKQKEQLEATQRESFRLLLGLMETGQRKQNFAAWSAAWKQYGGGDDYKKIVDELEAEQRKKLTAKYFE